MMALAILVLAMVCVGLIIGAFIGEWLANNW
jgi:hypothetical protein